MKISQSKNSAKVIWTRFEEGDDRLAVGRGRP